jgi:hypothetical protein
MLAALALVGVMAEPPVSSVSSQYLPAEHRNTQSQLANQYGTPAEFDTPRSSIQYAVPSAEYGVPSQSQNSFELSAEFSIPSIPSGRLGGANIPSNQYSVPHAPTRAPALSNQKGTKQGSVNFSGIRSPSGQHAAVAISDRNGGKAPSNHYGAPGASSRFENLSRQQSITAGSSSLPAQFGAHGALSRSGGANSLSTQYGAPATSQHFGGASSLSTQYGAPATSRHFGGASSLSTQYGAPRLSGRLGVAGSLSTLYDVGSHSGTANSLRTHYGVPRASSPVSGPSTLSSQYGAPASPSRFGGASSLATQYGAPSHSSPFNTPTSSQYASGGGYTASREGYKAQEDDLAVSVYPPFIVVR